MAGTTGFGLTRAATAWVAFSLLFCNGWSQPGERFPPLGGKVVQFTEELYLQMEQQLQYVMSVAVKTFQTPDGDVIDCVEIDKQPSLNHPLLKGHVVQKAPSFVPKSLGEEKETTETDKPETEGSSAVEEVKIERISPWIPDEGCPEGTIPIIRPKILESLREKYARKGSSSQSHEKGDGSGTEPRDADDRHDDAVSKSASFEVKTVRISMSGPKIGERRILDVPAWLKSSLQDPLDASEFGRQAKGYEQKNYDNGGASDLVQTSRKAYPSGVLEAFSTFKSVLFH